MTTTADEFLSVSSGGGDRNSASFSFANPGAVVSGTVTEIGEQVQQTEFGTGAPKVDKNNKPLMMLPVTIQTELRDWQDATNPATDEDGVVKDDVGLRTIWLRYKLRDAVASGLKGNKLRVGGKLAVKHTTVTKVNGYNVKEYEARYTPPSAADEFLTKDAAAPAAASAKDDKGWDASAPF